MAKLKGISKLNRTVKKALSPFGVENVHLAPEFEYRFEDNSLGYSLQEVITDKWFNEFVKKTFGYIVKNDFIISVLHELGHAETVDFISDNVYDKCIEEKEKIFAQLELLESDEEIKALNFKYFALPDELQATSWAVDFAETHAEELETAWNEILTAIKEFYTVNNITK